MCGSSSGQKNIAAGQSDFFSSLKSAYEQEFAGQTNILNSLTAAFTPILNAGPGQQGMTPAELSARTTEAMDVNAANYSHAAREAGNIMAFRGTGLGAGANMPSGMEDTVQGMIASEGARQLSSAENQITEQNYALGRGQFGAAAGALGSAAGLYNPTGFAGQATGSGSAAFSDYTTMQAQGNQWIGALGGALGGAMEGLGGGIGAGLGKRIGG